MTKSQWKLIDNSHPPSGRILVARIDPEDAKSSIPMWPQIAHWGFPPPSPDYDNSQPCWVVTWDNTRLYDQPTHWKPLDAPPKG